MLPLAPFDGSPWRPQAVRALTPFSHLFAHARNVDVVAVSAKRDRIATSMAVVSFGSTEFLRSLRTPRLDGCVGQAMVVVQLHDTPLPTPESRQARSDAGVTL